VHTAVAKKVAPVEVTASSASAVQGGESTAKPEPETADETQETQEMMEESDEEDPEADAELGGGDEEEEEEDEEPGDDEGDY
jgi:hypothetical protein